MNPTRHGQAANNIDSIQYGLCAALRFEREFEKARLIAIEVAQAALKRLGISEQLHAAERPAIRYGLLQVCLWDLFEKTVERF